MKRWGHLLWAYVGAYGDSWSSLFEAEHLASLIILTKYRGRRTVHIESGYWKRKSVGFGQDWVTYQVYYSENFNKDTNKWERTK